MAFGHVLPSHLYYNRHSRMPQVTLRTTIDGRDESITEYLCDWPDCPHIAVQVVVVSRALRARAVLCAEHAARLNERTKNGPR